MHAKISWENAAEGAQTCIEPFIHRYLWPIIEDEIMDGIDSADAMAPAVMQAAKMSIKTDVFSGMADSINRLSMDLEEKFANSDPSTWASFLEDETDGLTAGQKLRLVVGKLSPTSRND